MGIDWKALAFKVGAREQVESGWREFGGTDVACRALIELLGEEVLVSATRQAVSYAPGFETARSVLQLPRPAVAREECLRLYRTSADDDGRRGAIEVLRVVADESTLAVVPELLTDPDEQVQCWAAGVVRRLLLDERVTPDAVQPLLAAMAAHANAQVRAVARELRGHG